MRLKFPVGPVCSGCCHRTQVDDFTLSVIKQTLGVAISAD